MALLGFTIKMQNKWCWLKNDNKNEIKWWC